MTQQFLSIWFGFAGRQGETHRYFFFIVLYTIAEGSSLFRCIYIPKGVDAKRFNFKIAHLIGN
jgi:hypothetical protein